MKTLRSTLLALFTLSGFATAAELPPLDLFRDKEVVETFASIPVQESGRIKPLENVASYRLLRFRARRSIWLTDSGEMDGKPLVDPATQTLLPAEVLRARFAAVGALDRRVITYCGGGIAASADALVLTMLGHTDVKLYDASLLEWVADPALPMDVG